jgi:hypothetical protein
MAYTRMSLHMQVDRRIPEMTLNQHLHATVVTLCRFGQHLFAGQAVVPKQRAMRNTAATVLISC